MKTRTVTLAAALLAIPILVPVLLVAVIAGFDAENPTVACGTPATTETVGGVRLDAEQVQVATQVVAAVRAFRATANTPHAAVIALATARQESGIRNLDYGDRDSLGVFQQRPSQGWGTPEQVRDVRHATTSFLTRLVRQPDWETRRVTEVAAAVQRPAEEYRGLYQQWVPLATALTQRLWGTGLSSGAFAGFVDTASTGIHGKGWVLPMKRGTYSLTAHWHQSGSLWFSGQHTGQDFAAPVGTPVYAAATGRVVLRGDQAGWAGRNVVTIDHGTVDGQHVVSWYAHLSRADVHTGQTVSAGAQVGLVGAEGNVTGPHLHFEVRVDGADLDPISWLTDAGTPIVTAGTGCATAAMTGLPSATGSLHPLTGNPVVASLNVLGHSHTAPGGDRCCAWADSRMRIRWATTLLRQHSVNVAGLQEFQPPQAREFHRLMGTGWGMYPGPRLGRWNVNGIVWRTDTWQLVVGRSYQIPYFHGHPAKMPVVLLSHRATGQQVWFTNHHNPANAHGDASGWRARATRIEITQTRRLIATGFPVVVTGDMNERDIFYCRFTSGVPGMHAANGGSNRAGNCRPPRPTQIDWILGSVPVRFSNYQTVRTDLVRRASDHPLIVASMDIFPQPAS